MRHTLTATALASALFLSACGIKGSLYLPEPPAAPAAQAGTGADHSKADSTPNPSQ